MHAYDILLVGGKGFLGQQLAERLTCMGHRVTISSRRVDFRDCTAANMPVIKDCHVEGKMADFDAVVVLSVVNNNVQAGEAEVMAVNVGYPLALAGKVDRPVLFAFGSEHATDPRRQDAYSRSKRALSEVLARGGLGRTCLLVIPAAYGRRFVLKLRFVDRLSMPLRRMAIFMIGAMKPLVSVDLIAAHLVAVLDHDSEQLGHVVKRLSDDQSTNPFYVTSIRLADLFLAVMLLVGAGGVMLLIAILVRLDSPGPAVFRQRRMGRWGRTFICLKFRTMTIHAPEMATHEASVDQITRIGRWLRRWKLDELPQVFNVFNNDMSFVGPRPCLPSQGELVEERRRRGVLNIKPGITGLAQIQRIDMRDPVRLAETDQEYMVTRAIPQYIRILLRTALGEGKGDRIAHLSQFGDRNSLKKEQQ